MKRLTLLLALLVPLITVLPMVPAHATTDDQAVAAVIGGDINPFNTTIDAQASASACSQHSAWDAWYNEGDNFLGQYLWRFSMEAHKCWKGGALTYFQVFTKGTTASWTTWQYDGVSGATADGFPNATSFAYRWREGKFHYCLLWYCPTVYPWLSVKAWPYAPGCNFPCPTSWKWAKGQD